MSTTITPVELWQETQISNAAGLLFTANGNGALLKRAVFTNVSGVSVVITVYKVPSGGVAGTTNAVTWSYSVNPGVAFVPPELINMVFPVGAALWAVANVASSVNSTGSGFAF